MGLSLSSSRPPRAVRSCVTFGRSPYRTDAPRRRRGAVRSPLVSCVAFMRSPYPRCAPRPPLGASLAVRCFGNGPKVLSCPSAARGGRRVLLCVWGRTRGARFCTRGTPRDSAATADLSSSRTRDGGVEEESQGRIDGAVGPGHDPGLPKVGLHLSRLRRGATPPRFVAAPALPAQRSRPRAARSPRALRMVHRLIAGVLYATASLSDAVPRPTTSHALRAHRGGLSLARRPAAAARRWAPLARRGGATDDEDEDEDDAAAAALLDAEEDDDDSALLDDDDPTDDDFAGDTLKARTKKAWASTPPLTQAYVGASLALTGASFFLAANQWSPRRRGTSTEFRRRGRRPLGRDPRAGRCAAAGRGLDIPRIAAGAGLERRRNVDRTRPLRVETDRGDAAERNVDIPRGRIAATPRGETWIFRGTESRRRPRGRDVDIPRDRVAATPRGETWMFRGRVAAATPRPRRCASRAGAARRARTPDAQAGVPQPRVDRDAQARAALARGPRCLFLFRKGQ